MRLNAPSQTRTTSRQAWFCGRVLTMTMPGNSDAGPVSRTKYPGCHGARSIGRAADATIVTPEDGRQLTRQDFGLRRAAGALPAVIIAAEQCEPVFRSSSAATAPHI